MPAPRVALATAAEVPELDEDERLVLPLLAERGVTAVPAVWDDPAIDWGGFDLVVVRSTWDYPARRDAFLDWAASVERSTRLANPAAVLAWNTDKTYLTELSAAGVPVVATSYFRPGDHVVLPPDGEFVVKPAVSAGSKDSARYAVEDADAAAAHVHRLLRDGRTVMVQPYVAAVDEQGETAVVVLGGAVSHAVRKEALLRRGGPLVEGLFAPETLAPAEPTPQELAIAHQALAAVPHDHALLYARVDLLPDPRRGPVLLELELTEPSLFLRFDEGAPGRFADSIAAALAGG